MKIIKISKEMFECLSLNARLNKNFGYLVKGEKGEVVAVKIWQNGVKYYIVDITLRMLLPKELYKAQGFPPDYIFEYNHLGQPLTRTAQVRMCGNSVSPPPAAALIRANYLG